MSMARSPAVKFFLVGALIALLSIPLFFVWLLIAERQGRAAGVQAEVATTWGAEQAVHGPYLIVPYQVRVIVQQDGKPVEKIIDRRAVFLPETLEVSARSQSQLLQRGIYDVSVYGADLTLKGGFGAPDFTAIEPEITAVRWIDAIVAVGISDVSGLRSAAALTLGNGDTLPFEPSLGVAGNSATGIHGRIGRARGEGAVDLAGGFSYAFGLSLSGSRSLSVAPVARQTEFALASDWPHPSFTGAFLPATRDITAQGFTAQWRVPDLARSVPAAFALEAQELRPFWQYMMSVAYYVPVDFYGLVDRAAKYGLLFLIIAFAAVFVIEMLGETRVHAVQYVFVGVAMIFFFVLLLSLAEHVGFGTAYVTAAVATGGMLSLYVARAMASATKGLIMLAVFFGLYGLLYMILRLEDYALLAGALGGFVLLTVAMFATLRVDWSGSSARQP